MKGKASVSVNRVRRFSAALCIVAFSASLPAAAADGLCKPLREFIGSVKPGETRVIRFNTIVGSNFKDREGSALGAKRCDFGSYEPGKVMCKYLMEYSSPESSGFYTRSAITCLSPKTRFAEGARLNAIDFSVKLGAAEHATLAIVAFTEDKDLGGRVLSITATGS